VNTPVSHTSSIGTNLDGTLTADSNPIAHPLLVSAAKACNFGIIRMFQEGSLGVTWNTQQDIQTLAWHNAGFDVLCTINFQNSPVRCKAVPAPQWLNYINSIPVS